VGALANAYRGVEGPQKTAVQALLLSSIAGGRDAERLCAVQWAAQLFPFDDMAARCVEGSGGRMVEALQLGLLWAGAAAYSCLLATVPCFTSTTRTRTRTTNTHPPPHRYICILGAGDTKLEVREEAIKGLRQHPSQQQLQQKQQAAAAAAGAAAAGAPGAGQGEQHPTLQAALQYVCKQQPRLARQAEAGEQLALPQKSFLALIRLLQVGLAGLLAPLGLLVLALLMCTPRGAVPQCCAGEPQATRQRLAKAACSHTHTHPPSRLAGLQDQRRCHRRQPRRSRSRGAARRGARRRGACQRRAAAAGGPGARAGQGCRQRGGGGRAAGAAARGGRGQGRVRGQVRGGPLGVCGC
jgi:hypothetical protein